MFRPEQQDGETRLYLFQVSTDGELLVVGGGGTDDGEVIASGGGTPHGAIEGDDEVGGVTGLGKEVRSQLNWDTSRPTASILRILGLGEERAIYSSIDDNSIGR